jgi:hypothetical protein
LGRFAEALVVPARPLAFAGIFLRGMLGLFFFASMSVQASSNEIVNKL